MVDKAVGKRIRELREKCEMTREELANRVDITAKFLYEVENGKKECQPVIYIRLLQHCQPAVITFCLEYIEWMIKAD